MTLCQGVLISIGIHVSCLRSPPIHRLPTSSSHTHTLWPFDLRWRQRVCWTWHWNVSHRVIFLKSSSSATLTTGLRIVTLITIQEATIIGFNIHHNYSATKCLWSHIPTIGRVSKGEDSTHCAKSLWRENKFTGVRSQSTGQWHHANTTTATTFSTPFLVLALPSSEQLNYC